MHPAEKDLLLAYDFGTSSVKAALFDINGTVISSDSDTYPLITPKPGWIEQDPNDWLQAMTKVTRSIIAQAGIDTSRIAALNVCSQMCGILPVDKQGKPLGNCIIWLDSRSQDIAKRFFGGLININGYGIGPLYRWLWRTNGVPNLSGRDPITKILWLREKMPETWKQTYKFLDVKDFILHYCCKKYITTHDCAHLSWLMDSRHNRKNWSSSLLSYLDLDREILPDICNSADIVGELDNEAAEKLGLKKSIVVLAGAGDVTASAVGAGTISPLDIHLYIGTSAWFGVHLPYRKVDLFSGIGTLCSIDPELYLLIAAQKSGGQCVDWFINTFGMLQDDAPDYSLFERAASEVLSKPDNPFFFPWLNGEHVPKNNLSIRGSFVNLSANHNKKEMAHAVLEGVSLNIYWMFQKVKNLINLSSGKAINFVGGGANNQIWCKLLADILQCPINQMEQPHLAGVRGMAMIAGTALGWYSSLNEAAKTAKVKQIFYPDSALKVIYSERYKMFINFYNRNNTWFKKLN